MKGREGALPRIGRQDTIIWLGELGLAAWQVLGRYEGELLCTTVRRTMYYIVLVSAMDELCAMVWYAIVSHLASQAPAKCQVPYHRPSMICCTSMPMGPQAHSQVLIQADFSVPARMTADKGNGKRADMTVEWKGVALENAP